MNSDNYHDTAPTTYTCLYAVFGLRFHLKLINFSQLGFLIELTSVIAIMLKVVFVLENAEGNEANPKRTKYFFFIFLQHTQYT